VKRYHDGHSRRVLDPVAAVLASTNIPYRTHTVLGDPVALVYLALE